VNEIGDYAFSGCSSLTSIIIPEGVASIGDYAFSDCSSLASVVIPESVKEIGDGAFYNCPLLNDEQEEEFFMVVENMPEFPGGLQEMMKYISTTIKYPVIAQENGIQGRTICQFVVEKDGRVADIKVVRSSGDASLDKEAVRVIGIMPRWKPGKQRGRPVRVKYTIPINFRLQ
jgi:protein TonB